jgi:RNA polymerase sigma-70 factor (ECF subfamily)
MGREQLHLPPPFEELMRRHEQEIMRFLLRATGNREDAGDLFQETWLRAYRAYPRLAPDADARPWLYAIAANLWRNRARDRARRARVIVAQMPEHLAPARTKSGRAAHENDGYAAIHLRQLISALPRKQREALYLRYFAGLDYAEIGAAMQCSAQAARANVSQAARKLKAGRWDQ